MGSKFIFTFFSLFGMTFGSTDSWMASSPDFPDDRSHVLTLIYDLQNRVQILEDYRNEDERQISLMQSEIDDLRNKNNRLLQALSEKVGDVATGKVETEITKTDNLSGEVENSLENAIKQTVVLNNTTDRHREQNEDGSGKLMPDTHSQVMMSSHNLIRSRPGNELTSPNHFGSTRVGSMNVVAFHANLGSHVIAPAINQEIVFDQVITNNGDLYSEHTGTFTCEQPGTYVFSWNILTQTSHYLDSFLMKNGAIKGSIASASGYHVGSSSGMVVLQLDSGDDVWVKVGRHDTGADIYAWSMFSGFKLN